jgi:DNA-binding XRE family transcriptional regulator
MSKRMTPRQLTALREALGMTKIEFAKIIGVARESLSKAEHSKKLSPVFEARVRAARQVGKIPDQAWRKIFPEN